MFSALMLAYVFTRGAARHVTFRYGQVVGDSSASAHLLAVLSPSAALPASVFLQDILSA